MTYSSREAFVIKYVIHICHAKIGCAYIQNNASTNQIRSSVRATLVAHLLKTHFLKCFKRSPKTIFGLPSNFHKSRYLFFVSLFTTQKFVLILFISWKLIVLHVENFEILYTKILDDQTFIPITLFLKEKDPHIHHPVFFLFLSLKKLHLAVEIYLTRRGTQNYFMGYFPFSLLKGIVYSSIFSSWYNIIFFQENSKTLTSHYTEKVN
jgi:hypothetical protein